jgi:hypothetical protein
MADDPNFPGRKERNQGNLKMHTYSMRDCSRERYIFYLSLLAVAAVAIAKQAAGYLGVFISVTTFTLFAGIFYVFDRWAWRLPWVNKVIGIPDLAGVWKISGTTNGADGQPREWTGEARIEQTWSRIAISLETEHSRSRSGIAAIERDPGHGFRILYGYTSEPKRPDGELRLHRGTCEVIFSDNLRSGEATYFNDHQRRTCGTMAWTRIAKNGDNK